MTDAEQDQITSLCLKIQRENDRAKFDEYVRELDQLLEQAEFRIHMAWKQDPLVDKPSAHPSC